MILLPTLKPQPYKDSIDVAKKVIEKRKTLPKVQELLKLVQLELYRGLWYNRVDIELYSGCPV